MSESVEGTVTAYDAHRAIAIVQLDTGEEVHLWAGAYFGLQLPTTGDRVRCSIRREPNPVSQYDPSHIRVLSARPVDDDR